VSIDDDLLILTRDAKSGIEAFICCYNYGFKKAESQLVTQAEVIKVAKEALERYRNVPLGVSNFGVRFYAEDALVRIAEMMKRDLEFILEEEKGEL
jgi:hypothetical protein